VIFTDRIEKVIRPKKGKNHILRLIREILYFTPAGKGTDIAGALQYSTNSGDANPWSSCFRISTISGFDSALRVTARRHDLIAVQISDPREKELPPVGIIRLEDAESGRSVWADYIGRTAGQRICRQEDSLGE